MTVHEEFLTRHGIPLTDTFANYHYAYALYAWYMIESMQMAEDIEDGLCFDEDEVEVLLDNLSQAQAAMQYFRIRQKVPHEVFDVAETIALKGCRLEAGIIKGSEEEAVRIARMWIEDYLEGGGTLFSFEVAIYILFLLQQEVDYSFLIRRKE